MQTNSPLLFQLGLLTLAAWSLVALVSAATTSRCRSSVCRRAVAGGRRPGSPAAGIVGRGPRETARPVEQRVNEAINWRSSIKDLPPDVRAERLAPFVAESERLGMELLTQEQRSKLNQLRLQRTGMASLADARNGASART